MTEIWEILTFHWIKLKHLEGIGNFLIDFGTTLCSTSESIPTFKKCNQRQGQE